MARPVSQLRFRQLRIEPTAGTRIERFFAGRCFADDVGKIAYRQDLGYRRTLATGGYELHVSDLQIAYLFSQVRADQLFGDLANTLVFGHIIEVGVLFGYLDAAESEWARHDEDSGESYREALRDCLAALSARARRALDLFYRDRRSRTDVAVELDMAPDGVKTLMRRARETLRICIDKKVRA